ncbi:M48 family metallopeptidase [Tissierella sp. MB52-C2]|uniref:M48 family metallopeptidase n=1 Tax=Tissierella sp. MB52-C2 TaxID=3070999 RepID=UPI00280A6ACC|nr:M48 family metallopeptidase [Tissierella sp. MB52-C2]WMM23839.1 M48 family metallopeptidase [Tissierella sp. MB52-C2]
MEHKLKLTISIFFLVLLIFISVVLISEYINMKNIRAEYPDLPEESYSLRKENLNVWALRLILQFLIPLIFLTSRLSSRIRFFVEKKSLFLTCLLYGIIFFVIIFVISLPLNYYSSFHLSHKYGLSNQTFLRWLEISLKGLLINDLLMCFFIFIPFYIIQRSPRTWWLQLSILTVPVIIFMVFISPFVIDPMFNKYTSIEDEKLGKEITVLLHKSGIEDANIYKVDKSKDTNTMNAYMTGIFHSKRIVLWDTTINNLEESEVLSITAHEIGHYVKGHIWKNIIQSSISTVLLLFLVYITSTWILKLSNGSFGIKKLYDIAALPLLLLVLNFYSFVGSPIMNYLSRDMEIEADAFEITLTQDRESAVSAMEKLYKESLGLPRPSNIFKTWYFTHPTLEERLEFYRNYPLD